MKDRAHFRAVVDGLYAAFASHPLRDWTEPCLHCSTTAEEEAALHATPLRELSPEALGSYASKAMTTWGDEREFTHFLPRILEILATQDFGWPDIEIVFSKLRYAEWRAWPDHEQRAVDAFLLAKWQSTLAETDPVHTVEDVLCAIAQAADDLNPYLQAWIDAPDHTAARHLVRFVLWSWRPATGRLGNAFWGDRPQQSRQVIAWLHDADVAERLTELATSPSDELAPEALIALQAVSRG